MWRTLFMATLSTLFSLARRQTEGFLESIFSRFGTRACFQTRGILNSRGDRAY
ncbi:hypothetical protein [Okeania sp. KiyG1]|uniref:hypothetical protein n=1 Tax=Okeania sp. KiyG1 TaxID=2720165 RepID=UPI0019211072|nr:hypothetical protein [Okeania sp. KiyG1]